MVNWEYELKRYLAQKFKKEFGKEVSIDNIKIIEDFNIIDEAEKSAVINVYKKPKMGIAYIDVKMKIIPTGMMIDFEKEKL